MPKNSHQGDHDGADADAAAHADAAPVLDVAAAALSAELHGSPSALQGDRPAGSGQVASPIPTPAPSRRDRGHREQRADGDLRGHRAPVPGHAHREDVRVRRGRQRRAQHQHRGFDAADAEQPREPQAAIAGTATSFTASHQACAPPAPGRARAHRRAHREQPRGQRGLPQQGERLVGEAGQRQARGVPGEAREGRDHQRVARELGQKAALAVRGEHRHGAEVGERDHHAEERAPRARRPGGPKRLPGHREPDVGVEAVARTASRSRPAARSRPEERRAASQRSAKPAA